MYSTCQYLIHNSEFSHGCYAILIVYQTMPCFITSYPMYVVRPDQLSKDIGLLCLWACLSAFLVHPKGGRPEGVGYWPHTRVWCPGMRHPSDMTMLHSVVEVDGMWWQPCPSAMALPWFVNSPTFGYGVGVLKDVMGLVVHRCGTFCMISGVLALNPNHVSCLTLACMNRCY
jgi:hypothetical protein